jgi:hypothetical protein
MTGAKKKSGGFREGSGRKNKYGEETAVIRVPLSMIPKIEKMLEKAKKRT